MFLWTCSYKTLLWLKAVNIHSQGSVLPLRNSAGHVTDMGSLEQDKL
jgi:hypothetical protein